MAVNADGKFTKQTPEVVKSIEEAFAMDCSIAEVCLFANITRQTLLNWREKDPEWSERLDELRENPFLLARQTVIKGIKENYSNAMDYLKRKKRKEFGDNVDMTTKGEEFKMIPLLSIDEIRQHNSHPEDSEAPKED
jgi:hypothetical protein